MPRHPRAHLGGALCLLLLGLGRVEASEALLIDTSQSRAAFALRAMWIKRIDGEFERVEGVIDRSPSTGRFGVDVRIDAHSVTMEKAGYAEWARSPDFFDALRHPWIQFRAQDQPERVLREGGEISGDLTLRGITRSVQFVLEPSACPRPGIDCPVHARGEVLRSLFGMDARRVVLGDRVRLDFTIRAHAPAEAG